MSDTNDRMTDGRISETEIEHAFQHASQHPEDGIDLRIAKQIRTDLATANERLRVAEEVISRLPATADGVIVIPGDVVYHSDEIIGLCVWADGQHDSEGSKEHTEWAESLGDPDEFPEFVAIGYECEPEIDNFFLCVHSVSDCYSTREAAEATLSRLREGGEG